MKYCLYHADPDGFFSAYFIWLLHPDATFIKINYNDPEPVLEDGAEVWIVDFSWVGPKEHVTERLEALCARMKYVTVIDHHDGAAPALHAVTAPNFTLIYDITKAGTELCFDYYAADHEKQKAAASEADGPFPHLRIPYAAQLVADYDMWRHHKPCYLPSEKHRVESLNAALWMIPQAWGSAEFFKVIQGVCSSVAHREMMIARGNVALEVAEHHIKRALKHVVWLSIGGYAVPAVNSAEYPNEIATTLADRFPGVPFVAVFHRRADGLKFSLRARGESVPVNEVAALYGGGGRANTASFTVKDLPGIPMKEEA